MFSATDNGGDDAQFLRDIGDADLQRLARPAQPDELPVDLDRAGVRPFESGEDFHQRALAGAVLAEQRHHLAAQQGEIDALQGGHCSVALRDARMRSTAPAPEIGVPSIVTPERAAAGASAAAFPSSPGQ